MGWSHDLQRCKLDAGKMRNCQRNPGSPFSHKRLHPEYFPNVTNSYKVEDLIFPSPTINFTRNIQFYEYWGSSLHICKLRWYRRGERRKTNLGKTHRPGRGESGTSCWARGAAGSPKGFKGGLLGLWPLPTRMCVLWILIIPVRGK